MLTACFPESKTYPVSPLPEGATMARREGYGGDTFYVSHDGHFIGGDGFIVPMNFGEFFERFPDYVRNWVEKHLYGNVSEEEIEDWSQDLLMHLSKLPAVSKYRDAGKSDVIQTFDPIRQYGASERRFRNYINSCLANRFNTLYKKQARNPLSCPVNVSLSSGDGNGSGRHRLEATDEYVHSHSTVLLGRTQRAFRSQEQRLRMDEFTRFVLVEQPDAALLLCAVYEAGSFADARRNWCADCHRVATTIEIQTGQHRGHNVGLGQKRFTRAKGHLKQLATKFVWLSQLADAARPLEIMSRTRAESTLVRRENL